MGGAGFSDGIAGVSEAGADAKAALFSIKPPPPPSLSAESAAVIPMLAPPPSVGEARAERRRSREMVMAPKKNAAEAAGFDDGEFGEFQ